MVRFVESAIDLPAFKSWFGKSKVVKNGKPLVVYHGSNKKFNTFILTNMKEPSGDYIGEGFYFARDKSTALNYGSTISEYYLKIEKPIIINSKTDTDSYYNLIASLFDIDELCRITKKQDSEIEKYINLVGKQYVYFTLKKDNPSLIRKKLESKGYDGLIDNLYGQYAVFYPNQIKSATENNGKFSKNSNNIYE
jgi:hypothetical protein